MKISDLATELRARLIAAHPPLERRFRPGLLPEESRALAVQYGVTLTDEAVAFFSVLNGFDDPYAMPQTELQLLRRRFFESLPHALEHHRHFWAFDNYTELYPEFFEDDPTELPPLRFMGEDSVYFYALDLRAEGRPVWSMDRESGMSVAFASLEAMLQTLTAWLREGVLVCEAGEWSDLYGERARKIAEHFNPGVERWQPNDAPPSVMPPPPSLDEIEASLWDVYRANPSEQIAKAIRDAIERERQRRRG